MDPHYCLLIVPCSDRKRLGGRPPEHRSDHDSDLGRARRHVLTRSRADESRLLPAWQRYDGNFYRAAGPMLGRVAQEGRLIILSGGYGVLDARDPIGTYNRLLRPGDWPRGLLERTIAARATDQGLDVVAFAGASTGYARLLRAVPWTLPTGRTAHLVTMQWMRGVSAVSAALGTAFAAFVTGGSDYPVATRVERLDR
ncbi:hypothetical protein [Pedococcus sp. 5OH_020]|uniref:hypothetical protein n=1 Tax=Pedococcus sp. 5OH_020 TaxID=2989814 RepID=UPI0022E9D94A|nr:hypothetical protein [Pedococcus sp. 5OH_020]